MSRRGQPLGRVLADESGGARDRGHGQPAVKESSQRAGRELWRTWMLLWQGAVLRLDLHLFSQAVAATAAVANTSFFIIFFFFFFFFPSSKNGVIRGSAHEPDKWLGGVLPGRAVHLRCPRLGEKRSLH